MMDSSGVEETLHTCVILCWKFSMWFIKSVFYPFFTHFRPYVKLMELNWVQNLPGFKLRAGRIQVGNQFYFYTTNMPKKVVAQVLPVVFLWSLFADFLF